MDGPLLLRREVGEEGRVLPVRDAGHDQVVEIGENRVEVLAVLGAGAAGSAARRSPGLDLAQYRQRLDALAGSRRSSR